MSQSSPQGGMAGLRSIKPARVAVIQTSSERDHNSEAGEDVFDKLPLPWIAFEFFDETSVDRYLREVSLGGYSAVIFASNALFNTIINDACTLGEVSFRAAVNRGMGVLILQQFAPLDTRVSCPGLPSSHEVIYVGTGGHEILDVDISTRAIDVWSDRPLSLKPQQFGDRAPILWSELDPLYRDEWKSIATANLADGRTVDVVLRSKNPRGRTILSSLPLDWVKDTAFLAHLVARIVRVRGTLFIHQATEHRPGHLASELFLAQASLRGGHVSTFGVSELSELSSRTPPFRHFGHLAFSESWDWRDVGRVRDESLATRLENGGSTTLFVGESFGTSGLTLTVAGRPSYLTLADRFADWLETSRQQFINGPAPPIRALTAVGAAARASVSDRDAVPSLITFESLTGMLQPVFEKRLNGLSHVDGHVMPTAAIASSMEALGFPGDMTQPIRSWIQQGDYTSSVAALQQALLWLPGLTIDPAPVPVGTIDKLYADLLGVRDGSGDEDVIDRLVTYVADRANPTSRRAIVAECLTAVGDTDMLPRLAAVADVLKVDLDQCFAAQPAPLETTCALTAALMRIEAGAGLTVGSPRPTAAVTPAIPDGESSLLRREIELLSREDKERKNALTRMRATATALLSTLMAVFSISVLGGTVGLLIWLRAPLVNWFAIGLPVIVASIGILTFAGVRAAERDCEPKWLGEIRDFWQISRVRS